eukprot:1198408-Prymnesium_polylepis.1
MPALTPARPSILLAYISSTRRAPWPCRFFTAVSSSSLSSTLHAGTPQWVFLAVPGGCAPLIAAPKSL